MENMERYIRQADIIQQERLNYYTYYVIGTGAIGRAVSILLTQIGVQKLVLFDNDIVGIENLSPQGFIPRDIDKHKVDVVKDFLETHETGMRITTYPRRWYRTFQFDPHSIIFSCVDSMDSRTFISQNLSVEPALYLDGRMNAEAVRFLCFYDSESKNYYNTTLYTDDMAVAGQCTAKSTAYCSAIAAGLLVGQLVKFIRGMKPELDVYYNILASELTVYKE